MTMRTWIILAGIWVVTLTGCAGKGEIVALNLHAIAPPDAPKVQLESDAIIVVADFEDARADKGRLGVRSHRGGGESVFNVPGGKVGAVVAQVVTDYLRKRGWNVQSARPVAGTGPDGGPHITISGKVLELSADAKSTFGSTDITTKAKTLIEALNAEDGSIARMTVSGIGTQTVAWFDPEDAENLLSGSLSESLEKFVAETKIEKKILRFKK